MTPAALICCLVLAVFASTALGQTEDARLSQPRDKDHPADFAPRFADRAAWEARAQFLRHQVMVAQGLWPMPEKTPLNPTIHGRIERDAFTIEKVFFASMPGHYVSGNLYRPRNRASKLPAVLCPYGHWPEGRFVWKDDAAVQKELKSGAETDPLAARTPLQATCAMLARMGCVVFQYDMVGYCDSKAIAHREGFLDAQAILRAQSFMGLQAWNSVRAMDFVIGLPDVDPTRVAITGSSSGATQAMVLNAVDARAAAAVPIVMVSMNMQGGCVCENAPLYRVGTNNVELASLFAPKPQAMAAANDWTNGFVTHGLPEMRAIWRLMGAEGEVTGSHFDFGHNHNLHSREFAHNFLNAKLKLGWPSPVKEQPFEPVEPKGLSVYDEAHPAPPDACDAPTLRRAMTLASDAQLEKLAAQDPVEHQRMLRIALQAMVVDAMPAAGDVQVVQGGNPVSSGGVWNGVIARVNSDERVPCRAVIPAGWNGTVIVLAHPHGRAAIGAGGVDEGIVKQAADRGAALLVVDVFQSGSFVRRAAPATSSMASTKPNPNPPYAGYVNGYNRTVIAERVHDVLSAIALARSWPGTRSVRLAGLGEAGPWALLARAIAGGVIDRAVVDLNGFEFDHIRSDSDPMLLPGALKYGGIRGFMPLCSEGATLVCNAGGRAAPHVEGLTVEAGVRDSSWLMSWLLE